MLITRLVDKNITIDISKIDKASPPLNTEGTIGTLTYNTQDNKIQTSTKPMHNAVFDIKQSQTCNISNLGYSIQA